MPSRRRRDRRSGARLTPVAGPSLPSERRAGSHTAVFGRPSERQCDPRPATRCLSASGLPLVRALLRRGTWPFWWLPRCCGAGMVGGRSRPRRATGFDGGGKGVKSGAPGHFMVTPLPADLPCIREIARSGFASGFEPPRDQGPLPAARSASVANLLWSRRLCRRAGPLPPFAHGKDRDREADRRY